MIPAIKPSPRRRRRRSNNTLLPLSHYVEDDDDDFDTVDLSNNNKKNHVISKRRLPMRNENKFIWNVVGVTVMIACVLFISLQLQGWFLLENQGRARALSLPQVSSQQHDNRQQHYHLKGTPLSQLSYDLFPYYSPPILMQEDVHLSYLFPDDDDASSTMQHPPILHFVHTRFMQEQANLTSLGEARLHLFEVFCLPTLVQQTTDNFFWLIRFDPDLDASVFARLLQVVHESQSRVDKIYLVASNRNFRINQDFPGAWRDGAQAADLRASRIYTGNPEKLALALHVVDRVTILDTRLDADDGLNRDYLRTLQYLATREWGLGSAKSGTDADGRPRWKYWCILRHLLWHWTVPQPNNNDEQMVNGDSTSLVGRLSSDIEPHMCVTPGITVGYPIGVQEADVPVFPHHELKYKVEHLPPEESCGAESCVDFIDQITFAAIRSRTPTSAGMLKILGDDSSAETDAPEDSWMQYAFWNELHKNFGLSRVQVQWMQSYLTRHLHGIGLDNLHGQCTTGHSCKPEAKKALERLVALATNASIVQHE